MKRLSYTLILNYRKLTAIVLCALMCTALSVNGTTSDPLHDRSTIIATATAHDMATWGIITLILLVIVGVAIYTSALHKRAEAHKAHTMLVKKMPWAYSSAYIRYDKDGKISGIEYDPDDMNAAFRNILIDNKKQEEHWEVVVDKFISDKVEETLTTGHAVSFTYHFDKTDTYYEIQICQIEPPENKRRGLSKIGIFANDITKRKRQEQALIKAEEQARESDRIKSAFLANMSHEIRTPLNAIVGFSSLISQTDDRTEQAKYASIIEHNNDLLLHLINDVLDLAKIESNTLVLNHVDTDLNEILHSVYDTIRLRVNPKVVLNMVLGADECLIRVDPNRLSQVLINLLTNAAKFTTKGSITYGYEVNDDELEFFVHDTGIGISAENQKKLFKRFSKLNNFVQGTGLGLSICKSFVEKMGGTIWVKSRGEGKGSTFQFTIPYIKAELPSRLDMAEGSIIETPPQDINSISIRTF